jgi:hypothetical protein
MVHADLGGSPLFLAILAAVGFQFYALARGAREAVETLTVAFVAVALVGPNTAGLGTLHGPNALPLLAAGVLQLALWIRARTSPRALAACGSLAIAAQSVFRGYVAVPSSVRGLVAFHLALLAVLLIGAMCDDRFARFLRRLGALAIMIAGLVALMAPARLLTGVPPGLVSAYPLLLALVALEFGYSTGHQLFFVAAAANVSEWSLVTLSQGYWALRGVLAGLDAIALGLVFFVVAALISLGKAGLLSRWCAKMQAAKAPPRVDELAGP